MIKISRKNDLIIIDGHSGYSEYGTDIVCSSVSSIAITSVNAILKYDEDALKYKKKDGYLEIEILRHDQTIDLIIDNMFDMLHDLEKQYKNYIKLI
ncbi:MAG: ribosomal-processing cysteine protease Prp [Bacilli bacterium]|nr:ribosomal-processing cysteine protease Prp [Bacilli bacterium]